MTVYLPKRCRTWYYDFWLNGKRYVKSTKRRDEVSARLVEADAKRQARYGFNDDDLRRAKRLLSRCQRRVATRDKRFGGLGFVYFMAYHAEGAVKVGFATDPQRRLRTLQTANHVPIQIIATLPGTREEERLVHDAFADLRTKGEWFQRRGALHAFLTLLHENHALGKVHGTPPILDAEECDIVEEISDASTEPQNDRTR